MAIGLLLMPICQSASAQGTVEPAYQSAVVDALLSNNPAIRNNPTQLKFITALAKNFAAPLNGFQRLTRAFGSPGEPVCNLLCQKNITAAFWLDAKATPLDLVRYVHTATCYGHMKKTRGLALALLEKSLGEIDNDAYVKLFVSNNDRYFIRFTLGDLAKTVDPEFTSPKQFPNLHKLWKVALTAGQIKVPTSQARALPPPRQPMTLAANEACRSSL
jgi:hypothetical protein